jgi:succinyl-diaminopimelate desuccinylase
VNRSEFSSFLDKFIKAKRDDIVQDLVTFLKIASVGKEGSHDRPFGADVDMALRFFEDRARKFGMTTKNVDGYAVHAEIGSGQEMVMALTHADVVPAGSSWSHDCYGEVAEGKIYGRGAQDDKGPTIACLYALLALKESGLNLKRRVRHVVGGNEESGFRCVKHYFSVEELPTYGFSPDGYFPLVFAEKGSMNVKITASLLEQTGKSRLLELVGGERSNIVCDHARAVIGVERGTEIRRVRQLEQSVGLARDVVNGPGFLEFIFSAEDGKITVIAKGRAAHASTPEKGTNALSGLLFLLSRMDDLDGISLALSFMANAGEIYGKGLSIDCKDEISGKLTCNLGIARIEDEANEPVLTAIYNIRYPVKISGDELCQRVENLNTPEGIKVSILNLGKPHYTDPESFLVKTLLQVYRDETGDRSSKPMAIGGGTYARVIPGGVAYGPVMPGQQDMAHQADEYMSVENLMQLVRIYAKALYELAS